jgi:peptidoglycan/LPS O-acetylase OafA/YrhL
MTAAGVARSREGRFIAGNPLRAIGVLLVLLNHASVAAGIAYGLLNFGTLGLANNLPVRFIESAPFWPVMFFTLSGYLLGKPFVESFMNGTRSPSVSRYLRNRAYRILPGLFALTALELVLFGAEHTSLAGILAVPLLVQTYFPSHFGNAIPHAWTVDVEAAFYLLLPLGMWLLSRWAGGRGSPAARRRVVIATALAIALVSIAASASLGPTDLKAQHWLVMTIFGFTPGIVLAAVSGVAPAWLARRGDGRRLASAMMLGAAIAFAYYAISDRNPVLWLHNSAALVAAGLLVGAALVRQWTDGSCWRLLDNKPLQWLGERSYSFYLFHVLVLRVVVTHIHYAGIGPRAAAINAAITLALTVPVAALGYALVERPFLARKRAWRMPVRAPAPAAAEEGAAPDTAPSVPRLA